MKQAKESSKKTKKELEALHNEIALLRSALTSVIGNDREGAYRQGFVQDILRAVHEIPHQQFQDKKSFLAEFARI